MNLEAWAQAIVAVIGAGVLGVCGWLLRGSQVRRQLSSDGTAVRTDEAERGILSRLESLAEEQDAEIKRLRAQVEAMMEQRGAEAGIATAKAARLEAQLAELSAKRDLWRGAYRRLADEVKPTNPRAVALTAPSDYAPLADEPAP